MMSQMSSQMVVHRVLLVVVEHPLGQQRPAAADDADQPVLHERQMLSQHAGVNREVVDALLRLMLERLEDRSRASRSSILRPMIIE